MRYADHRAAIVLQAVQLTTSQAVQSEPVRYG